MRAAIPAASRFESAPARINPSINSTVTTVTAVTTAEFTNPLIPSSIVSVPLPMVDEVARPLNGAGPSLARLTQQHMAQIKRVCGRGGNTISERNIG